MQSQQIGGPVGGRLSRSGLREVDPDKMQRLFNEPFTGMPQPTRRVDVSPTYANGNYQFSDSLWSTKAPARNFTGAPGGANGGQSNLQMLGWLDKTGDINVGKPGDIRVGSRTPNGSGFQARKSPSKAAGKEAPSGLLASKGPSVTSLSKEYDELSRRLLSLEAESSSRAHSRAGSLNRANSASSLCTVSSMGIKHTCSNMAQDSGFTILSTLEEDVKRDSQTSLHLPMYVNGPSGSDHSDAYRFPTSSGQASSQLIDLRSSVDIIDDEEHLKGKTSDVVDAYAEPKKSSNRAFNVRNTTGAVVSNHLPRSNRSPSASTGNIPSRKTSLDVLGVHVPEHGDGRVGESSPNIGNYQCDLALQKKSARPFPNAAANENAFSPITSSGVQRSSFTQLDQILKGMHAPQPNCTPRNPQLPISLLQTKTMMVDNWDEPQTPVEGPFLKDVRRQLGSSTTPLAPLRSDHITTDSRRQSSRCATALAISANPKASTVAFRSTSPDLRSSQSALTLSGVNLQRRMPQGEYGGDLPSPPPPLCSTVPMNKDSSTNSAGRNAYLLPSGALSEAGKRGTDYDRANSKGTEGGVTDVSFVSESNGSAVKDVRDAKDGDRSKISPFFVERTGSEANRTSSEKDSRGASTGLLFGHGVGTGLPPRRSTSSSAATNSPPKKNMERKAAATAGNGSAEKPGMSRDIAVDGNDSSTSAVASAPSNPNRSRGGRIKVIVRKRPMGPHDVGDDCVNVTPPSSFNIEVTKLRVDLSEYSEVNDFSFDRVFSENKTNAEVYESSAKQLLTTALDGGSASCFAYGQTGSGKTYTMMGSPHEKGLYHLAAQDLFNLMSPTQVAFVSLFEIYRNSLYDLLNKRSPILLREDANRRVNICGLSWHPITSADQLSDVIVAGTDQRSVGSTSANEHSSRSHAVLSINIQDLDNPRFSGMLNFVDLAGSERAADTANNDRQTRLEGAEINKSLLALKECIRGLDERRKHVPFRGSKLTEVLRDSFTGNSQTVMIATIAPNLDNYEHSLNTIRYAFRVKGLSVQSVAPSKARNAPRLYVPPMGRPTTSKPDGVDGLPNRSTAASPLKEFGNDGVKSSAKGRNNNNNSGRPNGSPRNSNAAFPWQSPPTPNQPQRHANGRRDGGETGGTPQKGRPMLPSIFPVGRNGHRGPAAGETLPVSVREMEEMEERIKSGVMDRLRMEMQEKVSQMLLAHTENIAALQEKNRRLEDEVAHLKQCVEKSSASGRSQDLSEPAEANVVEDAREDESTFNDDTTDTVSDF